MPSFSFADRVASMGSSAIREILKITQQPEIISFAGGMPAPEMFPAEPMAVAFAQVLREEGAAALQYGITEGYGPLREWLAAKMSAKGIPATPNNILITSGSQQILDLAGKIFLNPGDKVIVESPVYLAAMQAFRPYQPVFVTVPFDADGMRMDALEEAIREHRPKIVYTNPTFQNPTGITMVAERRRQLAALAARYAVPVIEDDPYSALRYSGEPLPPAKSFPGGEWLIYCSSFSKIIAPGLRVGWAVADEGLITRLTQAKQPADVHTNSLAQRAIYRYLTTHSIDGHIARLCTEYRERRDTMLTEMAASFPKGVTWTKPEGGMFIWVTLPEGVDATALLPRAVAEKVAFVPGQPFYADGSGANTLRLNFSNSSPELIRTGIRRLGQLLTASV